MYFNNLPDWLILDSWRVLLGEIYPEIRAIALKYSPMEKRLLVRYYLDREPTERDQESIANFEAELSASSGLYIDHSDLECVHSKDSQGKLDCLDGWIYARWEYFDYAGAYRDYISKLEK